MSSERTTIQVDNVGKCFEIYKNPADRLKQMIWPPLIRQIGKTSRAYYSEFWALQNISFEIKRGQTVGIIGQNGSGKSTLLQIIAGILSPTYGNVNVQGRVAALLELGSGFNPEFSGRENVYLNASLLGLSHEETNEKLDVILSFADIGVHIDQSVKTYSSGMLLRLAFAVQAAVETEVLIIDEALAVGDARFQLKCFRRLEQLKSNGTTILFVSHAVETVRSLCEFGLVLEKGKSIFWGDAKAATIKYFSTIFPEQHELTQADKEENGNKKDSNYLETPSTAKPYTLRVQPEKKSPYTFGVGGAWLDWLELYEITYPNLITSGQDIKIRCKFSWDIKFIQELISKQELKADIGASIALANKKGEYIFGCNSFDLEYIIDPTAASSASVEFLLKLPYLLAGDYFLIFAIPLGNLGHHIQLQWHDQLLQLHVLQSKKKVFGMVGVDYKLLDIDPKIGEKI